MMFSCPFILILPPLPKQLHSWVAINTMLRGKVFLNCGIHFCQKNAMFLEISGSLLVLRFKGFAVFTPIYIYVWKTTNDRCPHTERRTAGLPWGIELHQYEISIVDSVCEVVCCEDQHLIGGRTPFRTGLLLHKLHNSCKRCNLTFHMHIKGTQLSTCTLCTVAHHWHDEVHRSRTKLHRERPLGWGSSSPHSG